MGLALQYHWISSAVPSPPSLSLLLWVSGETSCFKVFSFPSHVSQTSEAWSLSISLRQLLSISPLIKESGPANSGLSVAGRAPSVPAHAAFPAAVH